MANFYTNTNLIVSFGISYLLLLVSIFKFNKNIGEFWCLMVTGVPLINLFLQNILKINNWQLIIDWYSKEKKEL